VKPEECCGYKLLGAVTVDDALEAAIPGNWRQREPGR